MKSKSSEIKQKGIKAGELDSSVDPEEIPILSRQERLLSNLHKQEKLDAR
jgi:hypothetical protein